jgi:hypothetical protein
MVLSTAMSRHVSVAALALGLALVAAGCGDDAVRPPDVDAAPDAPPGGPSARFAPTTGPLDFLAVPYPCDLYRNGIGVGLGRLPVGARAGAAQVEALGAALGQDPGFGMTTTLFFGVDDAAAIDPTILAQAVHLLDLAGGAEVPLSQPVLDVGAGRIAVQPSSVLAPDHTYGAWIDPIAGLAPQPAFLAARAEAQPGTTVLAQAWQVLAPLWQFVPRERAVSAAVFRTHAVDGVVRSALTQVAREVPRTRDVTVASGPSALDDRLGVPAAPALPGLDNPGQTTPRGIVHGNIAAIVHGWYDAPSFLTATPDAGKNGVMTLDAGGAPVVRGSQPVAFTLVVPAGVPLDSAHPLPVALFLPGLGQTRADAFALADALAARGIATLAIDLLFHGDRSISRVDAVNELSGAATPDGIGDNRGDTQGAQYLGLAPLNARAGDPLLVRDDLRQSIVDVRVAVRLVEQGDLTAVQAQPGLSGLTLRADRVAGVGVGLGTPLLAAAASLLTSPLGAVTGSQAAGGLLFPLGTTSPRLYPTLVVPLGALFDVGSLAAAEQDPLATLFQQTLEPGDPLALLASPSAAAPHFAWLEPFDDELAANQAEEYLAALLGLPGLGAGSYRYHPLVQGPLPATANLGGRTAGVVQFAPASWDLLLRRQGSQIWQAPFPPFQARPSPLAVANAIVSAQDKVATFAATFFAGGAPTIP